MTKDIIVHYSLYVTKNLVVKTNIKIMSCNNELIIQESFEMEIFKWPTSHFLSSSN
jgi:hypothetical protein